MECMGWVKTGTEEAAAVDLTKYPDHFNLEVAEGAFKGFPPRLMQKAPPKNFFNCIYLFIYLISMLSPNYVPVLLQPSLAWNGHLVMMSFSLYSFWSYEAKM